MGSKKKNNTADKDEQDFASDVLAEELQGYLQSVPDQNADDFFNSLKDEMLEEGIVLEKSVVQKAPVEEFTNIDITPDDLKKKTEKSGEPVQLRDDETVEESEISEFHNFDTRTNVNSRAESVSRAADLEDEAVDENEDESPELCLSQNEVDAAVDEIFENSSSKPLVSVAAEESPVRVFEDKTSAIQEFPEASATDAEDQTRDLSSLEKVTSMGYEKAESFYQVAKRNPSIDLKNADYIKFAQGKIKSLEKELIDLRIDTQELALAGSHFKALADEREQRNRSLEAKISELQSTSVEEKKILNAALEAKETKISLLQERVESLEVELESKYNRLRVRERELESRLEILKQEQDAVASSKDELILRVKKQNNALSADLDRARAQTQKSSSQLQEKEDALRRTIKALKLSLTMLESQKQN